MSDDVRPDPNQPELDGPEDDMTAAEEETAAAASDTFEQASDSDSESVVEDADDSGADTSETDEEIDTIAEPEIPGKPERLQKILAQAGVASRRAAENLITAGRVQVNGKVVTELGTKADAARDHIRVDGKLLQGSERLRYFMLNKPRGFVTTVRDPEGRPTVMEFFAKLRERLYPVGRLDYLSEGLLLVTNDGDLANKLTRAAAGVEKTYLVKVSGEPGEEELDRLRSGVGIERGKPGSGRVQTAPAQIRKVRQGDNPWYEVILIEGRNRELRKMFEEIGHHVEKIRRVGYGPLVLDIEPGKMRELEAEELDDLRKTADGKLRKPKLKDIRRRKAMDAQLPTVKSHSPRPLATPPATSPISDRPSFPPSREFPPKRQFGTDRPSRPPRPDGEGFRPRPERAGTGPVRFGSSRPGPQRSGPPRSGAPRSGPPRSESPRFGEGRPAWKKDDRTTRPPARFGERPPRPEQRPAQFGSAPPRPGRPTGGFAGSRRPDGGRPFEKKPWKKGDSARPDRPPFKPHAAPRRETPPPPDEFKPSRPSRLQIEAVEPERESTGRSNATRPSSSRPPTGRPAPSRPPFRGAGLTDQALVVQAKAVRASSGRERTGLLQVPVQIAPGLIEPLRTDPVLIARPLIAHPPLAHRQTAPAVRAQLAAPAAPALENSAQGAHLGPQATARVPSPPAPANRAQAAPDPAINAPQHPQQGSPRGSLKQAVRADPLPRAVQHRPPGPGPAGFRSPVPDSRAKAAADGSRRLGAPAAKAPAASPEEKSEANLPGIRLMPHVRIAC